jgi:hypothetical protein
MVGGSLRCGRLGCSHREKWPLNAIRSSITEDAELARRITYRGENHAFSTLHPSPTMYVLVSGCSAKEHIRGCLCHARFMPDEFVSFVRHDADQRQVTCLITCLVQ